MGTTYGNGSGLGEETEQVEVKLSVRGHGNTARNHQHNCSQPAVRVLEAECPLNEKNGHWVESLSMS